MAPNARIRSLRLLAAGILTVSLLVTAVGAEGEEAAKDAAPSTTVARLTEKESKRRLYELRRRANRWYGERRRFPTRCHHCDGRKHILVLHPRLNTTPANYADRKDRIRNKVRQSPWKVVRCPTCKGHGTFVSKKSFMKIYYEMMSPAFRRTAGAKATVEALYEQMRAGEPWPRKFSYANQKRSVLVSPTHGIAWHRIQGDKTWLPTFWIWSSEGGKKSTWFQFATDADGAWPQEDTDLPQPTGYPQLP